MNFWIISPNVTNTSSEENLWKLAIQKLRVAIMGWGESDDLGKVFINKVQIGDYILIAQGANWQKKLFLAGKVSSIAEHRQLEGTPRAAWFRKLTGIVSKQELELLKLKFNNAAYGEANQIPAIYQLKPSQNSADKSITTKLMIAINGAIGKENRAAILDILRYKKQIILQGPPGTGKTLLAKELAKDLTVATKQPNVIEDIKKFLKDFDPNTHEAKFELNKCENLLTQFYSRFPKEKLKELTEEDYAIGTGTNDSFCWWLERGLKYLGYYFPGSARSYLLYYRKDNEDYSIHGKLRRDGLSPLDAMKKIDELISDLILKEDFTAAKAYFGDGFLLKLLHSYYPDRYFPVNSVPCLENILKLFKIDHTGLDSLKMNKKVQNVFNELKEETGSAALNHNLMQYLFSHYNIKGEIDIDEDSIINKGEFKLIQFHPSYTYEDFVRGISVEVLDDKPNYIVRNRILASFADAALNNPNSNYVLIIDEINRANLSSVLGELIYALEYRYDETKPKETSVESIYSLNINDDDPDSTEGRVLKLPNNLFIIGTMNTADRSVGNIDYAIRRRFAFVDVLPEILTNVDFETDAFKKVASLFVEELNPNNPSKYLSTEFRAKDVWIGHSYFIKVPDADFKVRLRYEIVPILEEYIRDGILKDSKELRGIIANL